MCCTAAVGVLGVSPYQRRTKLELEAITAAAAKRARNKRAGSIVNALLVPGALARSRSLRTAADGLKTNANVPQLSGASASNPGGDANSNDATARPEASRETTRFETPRRKPTVILEEPEIRTRLLLVLESVLYKRLWPQLYFTSFAQRTKEHVEVKVEVQVDVDGGVGVLCA